MRRLAHPWDRLELDILVSLHFLQAGSRGRLPPPREGTGKASHAVKAGCRQSLYFNGSGGRDAACGEPRQGG